MIASELAAVKAELARCVELAASGGRGVPAIADAIRDRERRCRTWERQLARELARENGSKMDRAAIMRELRTRVADWRKMLRRSSWCHLRRSACGILFLPRNSASVSTMLSLAE